MFQNCTSRSPDMDSIFALRDNKKAMTDDDVTIVTNKPFLLTGKCKIRSGWNAAYCPHVYGKVHFSETFTLFDSGSFKPTMDITSDCPSVTKMISNDF